MQIVARGYDPPDSDTIVTIELVYCSTCAQDLPSFLDGLYDLQAAHPEDVLMVDVACLAACDCQPTVMLGNDCLPQTTLADIFHQLQHNLGSVAPALG